MTRVFVILLKPFSSLSVAKLLLNSRDAAAALGVSVATLYAWLAQSDAREFQVRGQPFTIDYLQGGRRGQGRIRIESSEIDRLLEAMRAIPIRKLARRPLQQRRHFPGISVPLGLPPE